MKIAVIAHLKHPIREPFAGGLEMHTHLLARLLVRQGHDVTVFAAHGSDAALHVECIGDDAALISGVSNEPHYDTVFFREHHIYLKLMMQLRHRNFDVIHNNSLHYLPVVMADISATPVLTTLHTPPFSLLESAARICPPQTCHFVAVSESMRRLWSPIVRVDHVVPNGIEFTDFKFRPFADPARYFLWFGRIVPEKGLDLAIAAARMAGEQIWFAGPIGDPAFFDDKIAPCLNDRIVYLGHLTHAALVPLIAGATACIVTPRWDEPYGLVVAESLACGTPVAAFARGALPEIVDASCGVLVAPDDAGALAAALPVASRLQRASCRARAAAICDADVMIAGYERLYEMLLAR